MKGRILKVLGVISLMIAQLTAISVYAGQEQYTWTEEERKIAESAASEEDGAKAAVLINSLDNHMAFDLAIEQILNQYYKDDNNIDTRLEAFSNAIDERGTMVLQDYKDAWNERIQESKTLVYVPGEIVVCFDFSVSDEDILQCVNSMAAGGKIVSKNCEVNKCVKVILKKSQTTAKAIALFQTVDGVLYAERNLIRVIPGTDLPKLSINKSAISLNKKQSSKLTATLSNAEGKLKWSSDNPSVAKVDKNGRVTGIRKGKAVIKVSFKNATCSLFQICIVQVRDVEKVQASGKVINSTHIFHEKNRLITSYAQMQKLVKKYKSSGHGYVDKRILKQMNKYDKKYFKKYALCFSTYYRTAGYQYSLKNVYIKKGNKINVKMNVKTPDPDKYYPAIMCTNYCFIKVPKSVGRKCKSVTFS